MHYGVAGFRPGSEKRVRILENHESLLAGHEVGEYLIVAKDIGVVTYQRIGLGVVE
jgi:hypothetical protein